MRLEKGAIMVDIKEIINSPLKYSDEEKKELVKKWLLDSYEFEVEDSRIFLELLALHNHGDGQLHLGHPELKATFGPGGYIQLVDRQEGFHLSFKPERSNQVLLMHPKAEVTPWATQQNKSIVLMVKNLLKNGALASQVSYQRPKAEDSPKNNAENAALFDSKSPEAIVDEFETLNSSAPSSKDPLANFIIGGVNEVLGLDKNASIENNIENSVNMSDLTDFNTISVEIDMSSYLPNEKTD